MEEWVDGSFEVWSPDGSRTVHGVVLAAFGVHHDSGRDPPGWVVAHTKTRLYVSGGQPFKSIEMAKKFVERILPLTDWNDVDPDRPPDSLWEVQEIRDELLAAEGQRVLI